MTSLSLPPSPSLVSMRFYHHRHAYTLTSSSSSSFFHLLLLLKFLSSHLRVANVDLQTKSEALLRFFHNLHNPSPPSAKTRNWTNTTSACIWVGVQCSVPISSILYSIASFESSMSDIRTLPGPFRLGALGL